MRGICILLIITFSINALYGKDSKDKFDFDPPQVPEKPIVGIIFPDIKPKTGLIISATGIIAGTTISVISLQSSIVNGINNSFGSDFHRDLIFTSGGLIFSGISTVFTDYFLREISRKKDFTLKE